MRAGPAACYVLSPVPLSPSHLRPRPSLPVPRRGATLPVLKRALSLCVPTLGEQTPLRPSSAPSSAHPRGAASASACNRRAGRKTAAAALSCICHNCDLMEQSENASTRFGPGCSAHTPAIVLSAPPLPDPPSLLTIRPQSRRHTTRVFIISLISQRSDLFAPLSTQSVLRV